jgi:hypothetical protein
VFRKAGGFVYVVSVLISMEGSLSIPPKEPWDLGRFPGLNPNLSLSIHINYQKSFKK